MQPFSAGHAKVIDISKYQVIPSWPDVASSKMVNAVYVKLTEGLTIDDPMRSSHISGAHRVGLPVGPYHFAYPQNDPVAAAHHFLAAYKQYSFELDPMLDLEVPTDGPKSVPLATVVHYVETFASIVKATTGRDVILYTNPNFIQMYGGLRALGGMRLWLAWYPYHVTSTTAPIDVGVWSSWVMWQYTSSGKVPGIAGVVDLDVAISLDVLRGKPVPLSSVTLRKGDSGPSVVLLQDDLARLGVSVGPHDGIFGPVTEVAVTYFQQTHALVADGIVGPATWDEINKSLSELSKPTPVVKPPVVQPKPVVVPPVTNPPKPVVTPPAPPSNPAPQSPTVAPKPPSPTETLPPVVQPVKSNPGAAKTPGSTDVNVVTTNGANDSTKVNFLVAFIDAIVQFFKNLL